MLSDGVFHDICRTQVGVVDILAHWDKVLGIQSGQMPFSVACTRLVLDVFRLPPTLGNVVFPSALWGIIAMPLSLWVGWRFGGRAYALILMAVVAFSPMYIQMSRVAYFYPPCVVGVFLGVWCLIESWECTRDKRAVTRQFHGVNAVATLLLLYASAGAWPVFFAMAAFHCGCAGVRTLKHRMGWRDPILIMTTYLVVGFPLLTASWGVLAFLRALTGDNAGTDYGRKIMEIGRSVPILYSVTSEVFLKLGWGWTWVRGVFTGVILLSGVATTFVLARRQRFWLLPLLFLAVGIVLCVMAIYSATWELGLRRVAAVWPFDSMVLALGFYGFWRGGQRWGALWKWVSLGPLAVALGLWIHADMLVLKVNGAPVPFRRISAWLDQAFPKGTPVVTDRYFTAMCDFNQSHPTTNVVVISTVPNELPDIQEKTNFRKVTQKYLEDNPDAVFYSESHLYGRQGVSLWVWPKEYFKHHKEFLDEAAWALVVMGQNYFFSYYHLGILKPSAIYYNTLDDMISMNRKLGVGAFVIYGSDWRPVQTQDYQLWRLMMADKASVTIYNVTTNVCEGAATVTGVSAGGRSGLHLASANVEFPPNQIVRQQVPLTLKPGANLFELKRSGSDRGRLLIGRIEVVKSHD